MYLASHMRTAYAETLAMAKVGKNFRDAVAFAAEQFGLPLERAWTVVQDDWTRNANMVPGWLPANWRDGRLIYALKINEPTRWIDLTAAESIASLNRHLGDIPDEKFNIPDITLANLTGDDRESPPLSSLNGCESRTWMTTTMLPVSGPIQNEATGWVRIRWMFSPSRKSTATTPTLHTLAM